MSAEPSFFRHWSLVCADWLHAGEEYRLRTQDALRGWECAYCLAPAQAIDHVIPRSAGGTDDWTNRVPVCRSCNASKSATDLEKWVSNLEQFAEKAEKARIRAARARRVLYNRGRGEIPVVGPDDWWRL